MFGVGRDLCGSPSPTPLPKQGHLQQAAQDPATPLNQGCKPNSCRLLLFTENHRNSTARTTGTVLKSCGYSVTQRVCFRRPRSPSGMLRCRWPCPLGADTAQAALSRCSVRVSAPAAVSRNLPRDCVMAWQQRRLKKKKETRAAVYTSMRSFITLVSPTAALGKDRLEQQRRKLPASPPRS